MNALAGLVIASWEDFGRALDALEPSDATRRIGAASAIAGSLGHVTQQLDSWINVLFLGLEPNAALSDTKFSIGSAGLSEPVETIAHSVNQVRGSAKPFLEVIRDEDLQERKDYRGGLDVPELHSGGISLGYALARIAAHHYFHPGEIASARVSLGHSIGDYPGELRPLLD